MNRHQRRAYAKAKANAADQPRRANIVVASEIWHGFEPGGVVECKDIPHFVNDIPAGRKSMTFRVLSKHQEHGRFLFHIEVLKEVFIT